METIKTTGSIYEWNDKTHVSINMSSIYTALIKEAAKCNRWSSDILVEIKNISNAIKDISKEEHIIIFGFREDGVDGEEYVKLRNPKETYRNICVIEIKKNVYEQYGSVRMYTHNGSIVVHANFYEPEEFNDVVELLEGWK